MSPAAAPRRCGRSIRDELDHSTGHLHDKLRITDGEYIIAGSNSPTWAAHNLSREISISFAERRAVRKARRAYRIVFNTSRITGSLTEGTFDDSALEDLYQDQEADELMSGISNDTELHEHDFVASSSWSLGLDSKCPGLGLVPERPGLVPGPLGLAPAGIVRSASPKFTQRVCLDAGCKSCGADEDIFRSATEANIGKRNRLDSRDSKLSWVSSLGGGKGDSTIVLPDSVANPPDIEKLADDVADDKNLGHDMKAVECRSFSPCGLEKFRLLSVMKSKNEGKIYQAMQKIEAFRHTLEQTTGLDLYKAMWLNSPNSEASLDS